MSAEDLDPLLAYLKQQRGFDFTGYKRTTLERRIARRLADVDGVDDFASYVDYLEVHPDEFPALFNTILINVTGFFRDPPAWEYLTKEIVPQIIEGKEPDEPIRVWSAGCASGEETYTLAMVLNEALGDEAYAERVKIYATDIDDESLDTARLGVFSPADVEDVPPELVDRYFERQDGRLRCRKDLRRTIIFGRNDLVQDAPISRVDLLVCRNTLMYFNAETQGRILARFNFALHPGGFLFVGKSEMLITHGGLFKPVNLKRRVFRKVVTHTLRDRLLESMPAIGEARGGGLLEQAFEAAPAATVVVDREEVLRLANQAARRLTGVAESEIGRPLKDLDLSFRPVELRSHLEDLWKTGQGVVLQDLEVTVTGGDLRVVDLRVFPLGTPEDVLGAAVVFDDVTETRRLRVEVERSRRELETSYEELQSTVEELETTNEELQSTNEELETTNEELQSANEELETMNEELQSTNEELETINDEMRERTQQIDEVNAFLETILTGLSLSVVLLDRSLRVQVWNAHSAEIWGLRDYEAEGEYFLGLDIGLPVEQLKPPIKHAFASTDGDGRDDRTVRATNRRGRAFDCDITTLPLSRNGDVTGVLLLMRDGKEDAKGV